MSQLDKYLDKDVKVVFRDGEKITVAVGKVTSISEHFIEIERSNYPDTLLIGLNTVTKIVLRRENNMKSQPARKDESAER